jgi:peptidyl-prolyl cis-trans isomerase SurA
VEDAMYSLKPGQVFQKPIRTRMGYIILKLTDEQERYKVKVRHILLSESTSKDSLVLNRKADSLITLLKKGADFTRLAEENSDDPSSKMNGGVVSSWYSRSAGMDGKGTQLAPEFEAAIFKLKDGEISGKVKTDYGIHIIRRDSSWKFTEDEENQYLKKTYKRLYFEEDKREYLNNLRTNYGMTVDQGNLALFVAMLDTNKTNMQKNWDSLLTNTISNKPLYSADGKVVTVKDFKNQLNTSNELKGTPLNYQGMNEALNKIIDPIVFGKATANIETEYPDFKFLMDEFRDGILLFKVEALEVWDKLKFDSTKAKEYFKSTGKVYYTDHAYNLSEIYVLSDSTAKSLYSDLKNGADFSDLAEKNTQRSKFREKKGVWGRVNVNDNKLAKMAFEKGIKSAALLEPVPYENGFSIVKINSYEPPRVKTFEEAIPDFAPQYQDMVQKSLTENWLKSVKTKFPVKINEVELTNILKALNKKKGK